MDIYEKFGDFLLNMIGLTVGGIIFANVMKEELNAVLVYTISVGVILLFLMGAFVLFRISKKNKTKKS